MTLFDVPGPGPLPRAATIFRGGDRPRWARYKPVRRVACDECVIVLHENKGVGPAPRSARWSRTLGKQRHVLCAEHAEAWKKEDGRSSL